VSERGRFITLEGGEGAGKSTQIGLLAAFLRGQGREVVTSREPGGSPGAEMIRKLLVEGPTDAWDGPTEALLMFAARRDHLVRTVWPAIERGAWVISDRFADSTRAYQGHGHGLPLDRIEQLYTVAVGDFAPDLTLILDLPVDDGLARAAARRGAETRFEGLGTGFHERVRSGFRAIAAAEPKRCALIDASGDVDAVHRAIVRVARERLELV
jgi:dTMP kinase